jgi:hypothetical protein
MNSLDNMESVAVRGPEHAELRPFTFGLKRKRTIHLRKPTALWHRPGKKERRFLRLIVAQDATGTMAKDRQTQALRASVLPRYRYRISLSSYATL